MPDTSPIGDWPSHISGSDMSGEARRRQRFDALFEAHRLDIASYCNWRTSSRADAEDAVAEVFLVAWRKIDLVPSGAARAWLYATARRVTANTRRSLHRRCSRGSHLTGAFRRWFVPPSSGSAIR
ncbi:MAG TPA: sigma factor [Acidimicrobiia bacterium]|nr:sigma factor [Acidimicrobiia bacterium]